ncbi:hypothetical protein ACIA8K_29380 [Catenuloplanes sp. NPDC051500]|uniref:hypothetical protein n=1 Tax=Catenuloplanes sp. NPDC051500 TaxID=3363959 RepID=UPI0037B2D36E
MTNTEQRPRRHRAPSAIAGVITAAAGGTAIPELLGVLANVAQVALIPTGNDYFLIGCVVVGLLGMIALFDPGQDGYRDSRVRVGVTMFAVVLCGIAAGVGVADRVWGDRYPPVVTTIPSPSPIGSTPPSVPTPAPTSGTDTRDPDPPPPRSVPVPASAPPAPTTSPPGVIETRTTMSCTPATCETSEDNMTLAGTFSGALADGDQLILFVHAPDNLYYAGARPRPAGGTWSGAVHLGSPNGTETRYTYTGCLYRIDGTFAADLKTLGDERLNQGLESIPTKGTATELACRTLTWNRP